MAIPPDPNRCFVHFSRVALTAGTAAVSLRILLNQVEKQPAARAIAAIRYNPETFVMEVVFEPSRGGEALAKHQGSAGQG